MTGFEALTSMIMQGSAFWDMTPCSVVEVHQCLGGPFSIIRAQETFYSHSYTLTLERVRSSETSKKLHENAQRHISRDSNLQ